MDMDPGEKLVEIRRRNTLRERGLPLDTPAVAIADADADWQEEKQLQAKAYQQLRAIGWKVYNTSQPRRAKFLTPGIADCLISHRGRGVAAWWEVKTERGKQTEAQRDFQLDVEAGGQLYVLGPPRVLYRWLVERGYALFEDGLLISVPFVPKLVAGPTPISPGTAP